MKNIVVRGSFDDLRSRDIRFLEEASKLGRLQVMLEAEAPKFSLAERRYFVEAVRYVAGLTVAESSSDVETLPKLPADIWAVRAGADTPGHREFCAARGIDLRVIPDEQIAGFPEPPPLPHTPGRKKVLVTGCYDWFHSGHVRFCEEVSELGELYVVVGNDINVRHLKGDGKPMFTEQERRYVVGSIRYVTQCLVSSGMGWLDAEPEIRRLKPEMYAVNEDGDKPEKRDYCAANGIEYVVLKRTPKEGLTARSSTSLRGF